MKTKEEVIREAWGDLYNHGVGIDGNGWLSENYLTNEQCVEFNSNSDLEYNIELGYRPKSLRGIENNNGWLSLPKHSSKIDYRGDIWVITKHGEIELIREEDFIPFGYATHYQPIVKPNKPLY